ALAARASRRSREKPAGGTGGGVTSSHSRGVRCSADAAKPPAARTSDLPAACFVIQTARESVHGQLPMIDVERRLVVRKVADERSVRITVRDDLLQARPVRVGFDAELTIGHI